MARQGNGTNQSGQSTNSWAAYTVVTVAFWGWWDSYLANDDDMFMEYGSPNSEVVGAEGIYFDPNSSNSSNPGKFEISIGGGAASLSTMYTRPSAAAWHHYVGVFDRSGGVNGMSLYVDGALQTRLNNSGSNPGGSYGNSTLFLFSRNAASNFGAGRMAALGIWSVSLNQIEVNNLYSGQEPSVVRPLSLVSYWRLGGFPSPEPDTSSNNHSMTMNGLLSAADPPQLPLYPPLSVASPAPGHVVGRFGG